MTILSNGLRRGSWSLREIASAAHCLVETGHLVDLTEEDDEEETTPLHDTPTVELTMTAPFAQVAVPYLCSFPLAAASSDADDTRLAPSTPHAKSPTL